MARPIRGRRQSPRREPRAQPQSCERRRCAMQSSMPTAATRGVRVMSTVPLLKPSRRRPVAPAAAPSSALLTLYQRLLRYIRRLLSARRDVPNFGPLTKAFGYPLF
ncbi:hypothetical protein CDAR_549021 [Caerostris darwini]|uniref:Uncharacterized protein n=1 Tax=Caerostris darwini TaxID=1538125 RepID=A0AAV4WKL0_9ARAC|nr:hypothetical protein CDAR_549021 [Caerostris darwini]